MKLTNRTLGFLAKYKEGIFTLTGAAIIEKFSDIEPISADASVLKDHKSILPSHQFWATKPDVKGNCQIVDWPF